MIKKEFLDIVSGFNFWAREQETGLDRPEYGGGIKKYSAVPGVAIAIMGVRRSGKSFVAKQFLKEAIKGGLQKEQTLYVNFEEPLLEPYLSADFLNGLYETYRHFLNRYKQAIVVLDEIQVVPRWEKWVRIMLEKNENVKLIITGSSSKLLSSEIATVLTGRAVSISVFPLSFGEFLKFNGVKAGTPWQKSVMLDFLHSYIEYGGFPLIALTKDKDVKIGLLKEIFDGIILKDIAARHAIRRTADLKALAVLALQNFSSQTSVKKLSDILQNVAKRKMSPTTVNSFLHHFSEAFLFFYVPIFSYKIKDQMLYPKKLYCIDTGLINAVSPRFMENAGRLAENLVAVELVRRHGMENVHYWKNPGGRETDFVIKEAFEAKQAIQVCWDVSNPETRKRETTSLFSAMDELKLEEGLVITEDYEGKEKKDGKKIIFTPIWKWLLRR